MSTTNNWVFIYDRMGKPSIDLADCDFEEFYQFHQKQLLSKPIRPGVTISVIGETGTAVFCEDLTDGQRMEISQLVCVDRPFLHGGGVDFFQLHKSVKEICALMNLEVSDDKQKRMLVVRSPMSQTRYVQGS